MEEELKEMLGKRPDELEGETLKLFNAIMKIADERDELKLKCKELKEIEESHKQENGKLRERVKGLEEENQQLEAIKDEAIRRYNLESIPTSLVEEKIAELKKLITEAQKELGSASKEYTIYVYQKDILQKLLEKR